MIVYPKKSTEPSKSERVYVSLFTRLIRAYLFDLSYISAVIIRTIFHCVYFVKFLSVHLIRKYIPYLEICIKFFTVTNNKKYKSDYIGLLGIIITKILGGVRGHLLACKIKWNLHKLLQAFCPPFLGFLTSHRSHLSLYLFFGKKSA